MHLQRRIQSSCLFLTACATLALPAAAQQPNIRSIVHYKLKSDRVADFNAAFKDWSTLLKKNGSERYFTVWSSLTGPREFAVVRYYSKWADVELTPDPKMKEVTAQVVAIQTRIAGCTESGERWLDEMIPDLTLPRTNTIPNMVRTGRSIIRPERMDEVLALYKSDVFPALKKAGATAFGVARARFGTRTNEIHTYLGLGGWADFDAPNLVEKGMGADAYQKFVAKIRPLTVSLEYTVYRYWPELSYQPAQ